MDHYAIIGNPIEHSRSPKIHRLFGEQLQHVLAYEKIEATEKTFQEKVEERSNSSHEYAYFSPSYNHFGKWLFTLFIDKEDTKSPWSGIDFTYNFNNSSQLSLFYGSQKGGLVCANGSCVIQPDFDEGIKLTYRTAF